MKVNEIFYSLQGEGFLAGVPSIFIRLAGCPLRCRWCDTKYAWDESAGTDYSIGEIVEEVQKVNCSHIVITGGEPMVTADMKRREELPDLTIALKEMGRHITIETTGLWYEPQLKCDLMSISPKLSNAVPEETELALVHNKVKLDSAVLRELIDNYNYQLKFVVDSQKDIDEIQRFIKKTGGIDVDKVMLMPQAKTREQLLVKSPMVAGLCRQTGFTFCQRLQVLLWNNQRAR